MSLERFRSHILHLSSSPSSCTWSLSERLRTSPLFASKHFDFISQPFSARVRRASAGDTSLHSFGECHDLTEDRGEGAYAKYSCSTAEDVVELVYSDDACSGTVTETDAWSTGCSDGHATRCLVEGETFPKKEARERGIERQSGQENEVPIPSGSDGQPTV